MSKFKSKVITCLLVLFGIFSSTLIWSILIEPNLLLVRNYSLNIPNWPKQLNGMKVAVIADIHVGSLFIGPDKLKQIVDMTNNEKPDLVFLLGDFIAEHQGICIVKPEKFVNQLIPLKAKLGIFAVLGNHDWWYDGNDVYKQLTSANIKVLEDDFLTLKFNEQKFCVAGVSDLMTRSPNPAILLTKIPQQLPVLLITHNPDIFPAVSNRVSLSLAGHTHGGQVAFPLIGPLITFSKYGSKYSRGHVVEDGKHLFVSTGIGTSIFPIRFLTIPEISILTLNSI